MAIGFQGVSIRGSSLTGEHLHMWGGGFGRCSIWGLSEHIVPGGQRCPTSVSQMPMVFHGETLGSSQGQRTLAAHLASGKRINTGIQPETQRERADSGRLLTMSADC